MEPLKMEPELPSKRNRLARLIPQTFGMSKQGKITFALALKQGPCVPKNCLQREQESRYYEYLIMTKD